MDFNILRAIFLLNAVVVAVFGFLLNFFEQLLPPLIAKTFRYGKFAYEGKSDMNIVIELPKSWFKHFYLFAIMYSSFALYLVWSIYLNGSGVSYHIAGYLDLFAGMNRKITVDPFSTFLAVTLISLQCFRRFYETWFVSVFSKGKINLSHYLVGYMHYWGTITIILSEAHGFSTNDKKNVSLEFSQLSIFHIVGVLLFGYFWYKQYECAVILANLRKNAKGTVVTEDHKIPTGGLFNVLSSPHLTCEVMIYLALTLVLRQSQTFPCVLLWVFVNQLEVAYLNHWWYQKTFNSYPKTKNVFIPYIL